MRKHNLRISKRSTGAFRESTKMQISKYDSDKLKVLAVAFDKYSLDQLYEKLDIHPAETL